jgi:hypothetical protein
MFNPFNGASNWRRKENDNAGAYCTVRTNMRLYTRLSNGFSRKVQNHAAAIALNYIAYNFIKIHRTLHARRAGGRDRRRRSARQFNGHAFNKLPCATNSLQRVTTVLPGWLAGGPRI